MLYFQCDLQDNDVINCILFNTKKGSFPSNLTGHNMLVISIAVLSDMADLVCWTVD
jgi:hypothetical protein